MIEVFKTNVERSEQATKLIDDLTQRFPLFVINFDLEDCDKILRVKGKQVAPGKIISILNSKGYQCIVLD